MSADPERRSIYYQNAGFQALTAGNLPQASCIAPMNPLSARTNAKPPELARRRPFWRQAAESTFLAIDQMKVKIPEAPPAWRKEIGAPNGDELWVPDVRRSGRGLRPLIVMGMLLTALSLGWLGGSDSYWPPDSRREEPTAGAAIDAVVERIIGVESDGDPNAKNKRSSATGLGQFLNETWLDMIRAHRPDLAKGRSQNEILELRRDAKVAREITARFTERNAGMLRKRGLPVTPGTLYLAHFAGGAGAVAILSALENADAALVMATADATGRTKREKIIKANPFLERFTVADIRSWADRKMRVPGL
jgi:hypothetical protein